MQNDLLLLISIYLATFFIIVVKVGKTITPFHFCIIIFLIEACLCYHPLMQEDPFYRTQENPLNPTTKLLLLLSSFTILICSCFLKRPQPSLWKFYYMRSIVPSKFLIAILFATVSLGFIVSLHKLGTLPIFYLSTATDISQLTYDDAFLGPINFVGWGAGRILSVWLTISVVYREGTWRNYFRKNSFLVISTFLALIINTMDGLRNMILLAFMTLLFALSLRGLIKIKHLVITSITIILLFSLLGVLKQGEKSSIGLSFTTGTEIYDKLIYSVVSYAEPNFYNLNNLITIPPSLKFGTVFLTHLIPGPLIRTFMEQPDTAVQLLADTKSFAQPGFTFRTIYADLFVDFGMLGTVLVSTLIYGLATLCFNRASSSPYFLLGFIFLSPAICFFPMMNLIFGIQTFTSGFVFLLFKFQPLNKS